MINVWRCEMTLRTSCLKCDFFFPQVLSDEVETVEKTPTFNLFSLYFPSFSFLFTKYFFPKAG